VLSQPRRRQTTDVRSIRGTRLGTVLKALELLDYFTQRRPQIGLSDLHRLAGLNKATCFRLMSELAEAGLVEQIGSTREYRIGPAVLRLAALREAHVPTREAAMPILRRMAEATGETAHLSHRVGDKLVTLAFAYASTHATRVMMEDADVLPWHATSSGHAVLAFLPAEDRDAILARPLPQVTPQTETDPARLTEQIAQVARNGFAETAGTFERDVKSIAVPLFGPGMQLVGALGIVAPTSRITPDLHQTMLRETIRAADDIIALWGGEVPAPLRKIWGTAVLPPSNERPAP